MDFWIIFLVTFFISYFFTPLLRSFALKFNILDHPGHRKIHKEPIPFLGGAAIYLSLVVGLLLDPHNFYLFLPLLIGATVIFFVGLLDDLKGLSARYRLLCQFLVALIIIISGNRIDFLPDTFWGNACEIFITVFWMLGIINACNYLDGMDGLVAGSAVVNLFCFALILYRGAQLPLAELAVILIAACLGFLPHNFKKKKIFLGDAGSTLLGYLLACVALIGSWAEDNIVKISIPLLILGVPIFDMIFTTVMRIRDGKIRTILEWLHYGAKDHFHHYLVDIGLKPVGAVIFIYFITLFLGISALIVSNNRALEGFLALLQSAIIFGVIATLIVVGKRRRSGWNRPEK